MAVRYYCTEAVFKGVETAGIIPFDARSNLKLLHDFLKNCDGRGVSFSELRMVYSGDESSWEEYIIINRRMEIISRAAIWKNSEISWEIVAVGTASQYRSRGYGTMLVSYCTQIILESNKIATLTTAEGNTHMQRTAEKLGYIRISEP